MTVRSMTVQIGAVAMATAAAAALADHPDSQYLGPIPYLSAADSPFDLLNSGCAYVLEDFENGVLSIAGVSLSTGAIKFPSPTTNSVDADDGVIDGSGNDGHSWAIPGNQILTILFDPGVLGGFPTEAGLVWTDGLVGGGVTFAAIDFQGNLIGGGTVFALGQQHHTGFTGDDRFVGIVHPPGISAITMSGLLLEYQIDHLQFRLPNVTPTPVEFYGPLPYLSGADSPLGISRPRLDAVLEDFEDGVADAPGVTFNFTVIGGPGGLTDSVDGDTGKIDGSGTNARAALKANTAPLVFDFDAAALGGLPTQFGVVITELATGPQDVTMKVFGASGCLLGQAEFVIVGDAVFNGTTAEDRFIGASHPAGIKRVEVLMPSSAMEFDHVQYDLPVARDIAFIGPRPYLSAADSLFDLSNVGFDFALEDFESGSIQVPGLTTNLTSISGPGGLTDSVDADTGVIDGSGTNARSGLLANSGPLVLEWNAAVLGGLPTQVGLVITDLSAGNTPITVTAFDENLQVIGQPKVYNIVGDAVFNGTTAEDRFIGADSAVGIRRLTLTRPSGGLEVDHIQYNLPNPIPNPFNVATPYLSVDDSPLVPIVLGSDDLTLYLEDFENASFDLPGTSINLDMIMLPGPTTDSVDADTGEIDGSGNDGHSAVKFVGAPLVIAFDDEVLGALPVAAGIVWTDCGAGVANVTMEAFDGDGNLIATKTFYSLGDNLDNGATEEDRYLGIVHEEGIKELRYSSNRLIEFDHVQFVAAEPNTGVVGDLNGDGIVDGADLGILLANWGPCPGCAADLNGDGTVDGADLGILLANWGSGGKER